MTADLQTLTREILEAAARRDRLMVALAGPPAAGKSTLSELLCHALNQEHTGIAVVVPMDGYHYDNAVLEPRGHLFIKGAPETFDADGLVRDLQLIRQGGQVVAVPVFDRPLDLARAGGRIVTPDHRVVIVEGNYLLLDQAPWTALRGLFDLTVFLDVPDPILERRLFQRWLDMGQDPDGARERTHHKDMLNARLIKTRSAPPDRYWTVAAECQASSHSRPRVPRLLDLSPRNRLMINLNSHNLARLDSRVATPAYDRSGLSAGIVHFGVGGFHRAHQAMYLDSLMNQGRALDWGIVGVGVMPGDRGMQAALAAQDYLYTLVVKHPDGQYDARVIGSMMGYLFAPDDPDAVIEQMADPAIRIVSLTVTEGGYNFHPVTGEFNLAKEDVRYDLEHPDRPRTTFGLVTEAVRRRRERGIPPFTLMSCDNIQGNGEVARRMFVAFARQRDPELGDWMDQNLAFPNAMVDRITPVTRAPDIAELQSRFGIDDRWPVVCEPFTQWVLEDRFSAGRPPLEAAGVQVVDDVEPYELMKLRLLNASHQALCYFGYLSGYRYAHEVCRDPLFVDFLMGYMVHEGSPTLAEVPGVDLADYRRILIDRFANPQIKDTLARLCAESSDRIPKWLLPVIRRQLATGGQMHRAAAVVASWARYAEGRDEAGETIAVVDPLKDSLMAIAAGNRNCPTGFIENRELFGDLANSPRFREAYLDALSRLHTDGARATVAALVNG